MRSKTSCFNGTLFRKNLSRYWPLWGLASFGGAMFPLAMLLELLHNGFRFWSPLETRQAYYTVLSYGVPVISIVYAILCAMAVWSYLYNARSVGMMHTLPIRREGLFVTNVLSGLTMMAIPYAVTGVLTVLVFYFFRGRAWWCLAGQLLALYWLNVEMLGGLMYPVQLFGVSFEICQQGFALLALVPIWLYRGRQGYHSRWFQYLCYAFYPVHMLVLALALQFLNR